MFYESSTRKLVNILESLSTQLTVPCATRHCPDTDSFDSVLSRYFVIVCECVLTLPHSLGDCDWVLTLPHSLGDCDWVLTSSYVRLWLCPNFTSQSRRLWLCLKLYLTVLEIVIVHCVVMISSNYRRSSEHSSLLRGPPTPSSQTREDENISFDCGDVGGTSSLYRKHDSLHSILPPPPPQLAQNKSR